MQEGIVDQLVKSGAVETKFNTILFSNSDSREPELAGIKGAILGSMLTLMVTLLLSFPIAVATAIYLEEFAPTNKITDFIEVNINNLAAVPSVIFGLLGLAVFINFFGMPRSVPLVGGFVLTLMGWFAPPMNTFVLNVRMGGPIALLVGFVFMLFSCLMCAVNQGKCCTCCYKTKTMANSKTPVLNGPIIHRRAAIADTCMDSPATCRKGHRQGQDKSVVVANQQTLDYPKHRQDIRGEL